MAEPFGIVGVVGQIAQVAVNLGLDWKDAPLDAKRFLLDWRYKHLQRSCPRHERILLITTTLEMHTKDGIPRS